MNLPLYLSTAFVFISDSYLARVSSARRLIPPREPNPHFKWHGNHRRRHCRRRQVSFNASRTGDDLSALVTFARLFARA